MARAAFRDYKRLIRGANQFTSMLKCDCINGYGLGVKRKSGQQKKDQLAIIVFVNKKLSLRNLPLVNRIPEQIRIPDDRAPGGVLEFHTDVQEARFSSLEYVNKMRPAKSGISIGHIDITAGTLGGLVRDSQSSKTVILSNNHVLANSNDGVAGDSILQPGPHDNGTDPADQIATLTARGASVLFESASGAGCRDEEATSARRRSQLQERARRPSRRAAGGPPRTQRPRVSRSRNDADQGTTPVGGAG